MTKEGAKKSDARPAAGTEAFNRWLVRSIFDEARHGTFEPVERRFLQTSLEIGVGQTEFKHMTTSEREAKARVLEKLAVAVARLEMIGKALENNPKEWRIKDEQLREAIDSEALARFIAAAARRFGSEFADPIARALKESYALKGERLQAVRDLGR